MAFTFTRTTTLSDGATRIVGVTGTATAAIHDGFDFAVAAGAETEIPIIFDKTKVKGIVLLASVDMTLYLNDDHAGSPTHHLDLPAGREVVWLDGDVATMPIVDNITASVFIRNATITDGTFKFALLRDPA